MHILLYRMDKSCQASSRDMLFLLVLITLQLHRLYAIGLRLQLICLYSRCALLYIGDSDHRHRCNIPYLSSYLSIISAQRPGMSHAATELDGKMTDADWRRSHAFVMSSFCILPSRKRVTRKSSWLYKHCSYRLLFQCICIQKQRDDQLPKWGTDI